MVIARGQDGKRELLVLGLSAKNVERLTASKPMVLNSDTHPGIPEGLTIMITYGETEEAIHLAMKPAMGPDTIIRKDPRL